MPEADLAAVLGWTEDGARPGRLALHRLTPREAEILRAPRGDAIRYREARISALTVQSHVKNILAKLGVHSRLEAVTPRRHGFA
jgi:DNA-binding CsgD family transcriptional regulator